MEDVPSPVAERDWSELPADILIRLFGALEIPDLLSSSAVCQSWNTHSSTARRLGLCTGNQGPWLLYSSRDSDGNTATLLRLSNNRVHCITSLPEPSFRTRYIIGSSHGWLIAADEQSELHLFNPVTRAQIELPPLMTLEPVRFVYRKNKEFVGHAIYNVTPVTPSPDYQRWVPNYPAPATRFKLYNRAVLSSDPSDANCIVVIIHNPSCQLSFARIGDCRWTWVNLRYHCINYHDCIYNDEDGLFYVLGRCGDLTTFDLNRPDPVMNFILDPFELHMHCTKYLAKAPWGDLLQVWRYHDVCEDDESKTYKVVVYKIDLPKQEIVEIKDLRGHALFVGFSSSFFVPVIDFPSLSPNCVYLAHDSAKSKAIPDKSILKEVVVFNMEDESLSDISSTLPNAWHDIPSPVWFKPSLAQAN
ncbi:hypothetical protein EJB05_44586 [Eragrostis curvula]|uniref:F-box domain-containing protein n=1 Tax=Eragrostis curvula TaxID=38414 RepID=A0A5J9TIA9_9POAL|nr:hypothetical protein EJB05_44586 [Eragrostis curvula]